MNINRNIFIGLLTLCLTAPLSGHASDPFAGLPDPTRYKKTPKKIIKRVQLKPLVLQSTLISEQGSYAIINGKQVGIGERIDGATLLTINPFNVIVERRGRQETIHLIATGSVRKIERPN